MKKIALAVLALAAGLTADGALAQEKTVSIAGFGVKSGVLRLFGVNSEAAMPRRTKKSTRRVASSSPTARRPRWWCIYLDDRCNAEEGIAVVRRIVGTDALVAIGPTCSNVAEPLYGILQKKSR